MKRPKQKHQKPASNAQRSPGATPRIVSLSSVPTPLATLGVIELTEQNLASSIDGHPFVVVDFRAPSSAPSRAFASTFAAAAARNPDVLFGKVDAEAQRAMVAQFNIRSIPTLVIFRNNIIVYAKAGVLEAGALNEVLGAMRALDMEEVRRKVVSVSTVALGVPGTPKAGADAQATAAPSPLSIEAYLRPPVRAALTDAGERLAAGGLVEIRDAFEPDFAERMFRGLDSCAAWRVYENYEGAFHYHHHNLYDAEDYPPDLAWCSKIFDSPETKAWVTRLSARSCPGPAEVSASWYLPGDHSLPHNDVVANEADSNRQVAFVWHLSKDWRPEWGGALFWCSKGCYLPPVFNTLWLFNVGPESNHFVTHVSPYAQGKRLTINGWWTGPGAPGNPAWQGPDRIGTGGAEILVY
jgi:thiol-disulfide isomerase/thioredoxin